MAQPTRDRISVTSHFMQSELKVGCCGLLCLKHHSNRKVKEKLFQLHLTALDSCIYVEEKQLKIESK